MTSPGGQAALSEAAGGAVEAEDLPRPAVAGPGPAGASGATRRGDSRSRLKNR